MDLGGVSWNAIDLETGTSKKIQTQNGWKHSLQWGAFASAHFLWYACLEKTTTSAVKVARHQGRKNADAASITCQLSRATWADVCTESSSNPKIASVACPSKTSMADHWKVEPRKLPARLTKSKESRENKVVNEYGINLVIWLRATGAAHVMSPPYGWLQRSKQTVSLRNRALLTYFSVLSESMPPMQ